MAGIVLERAAILERRLDFSPPQSRHGGQQDMPSVCIHHFTDYSVQHLAENREST